MAWHTNDVITNPGTDEILADTGALAVGSQGVSILVDSDSGCAFWFEQRNSANTATVHKQRFSVSQSGPVYYGNVPITLGVNERLRLRLEEGFIGSIQGSLFT